MFGAGDLKSNDPYGLTPAEKEIVKNQNFLKDNQKKIKKVDVKFKELNERVDGLESLFEGESIKLNKINIKFKKQIEQSNLTNSIIEKNNQKIKQAIENLKIEIENLKIEIEKNDDNIKILKKSFDNIITTVNQINGDYVTKKEFNKLIDILDKRSKNSKKIVKKRSNKEMMIEARKLFKKDYFSKAKPILETLVSKNYRPAECNFYLGEISYYRKQYKDALHYFKLSMTLYDKAKYLPKLLLHSAYSFDKLGDSENAQNFYITIVDIYPNTNEAKKASKKIK